MFQILNISKDVVSIIWLSMILLPKKFYFDSTRQRFSCSNVRKRKEYINFSLTGATLSKRALREGNCLFKFNRKEFVTIHFK